jgi:Mrp family chromosome partitioning ATPase
MIADALSRAGSRVLLVDADLRQPLLHRELGVPLSPGVVEVATGQERLNDSVHRSPTGSGAVVLSAGALEDNNSLALALLGSGGVHTLVQRAGAETSVVLTSSATPLEDALLVVHQFPDAVLLAVDARTARRAEVVETVRVIRSIGGTIVGALCVHSAPPASALPARFWRRRDRSTTG